MFSHHNQEVLERAFNKLEHIYDELDKSKGPSDVIKLILVNFYSVSTTNVDEILENIKSIEINLLPKDLEDGGVSQFREKLRNHPSLGFILNKKNIVSAQIESLYQPLMYTPYQSKTLELFDKFINYFRIQIPFKLMAISFNIGGPYANRSGECQAFQLLGKILDDAHQSFLPDREVKMDPHQKVECRIF